MKVAFCTESVGKPPHYLRAVIIGIQLDAALVQAAVALATGYLPMTSF
jgi:hypothetical protein